MAKVYPNNPSIISGSCNLINSSEGKETFTMWMKSLVFHGNGCTIFNSKGEVVYRVENYQRKCSSKVFLMDSSGKVLFSVKRKIFGCWEGCEWDGKSKVEMKRPFVTFQVKRNYTTFLSKDVTCGVNLKKRNNENAGNNNAKYKIIGSEGKSAFKIIDHFSGQLLAEAVQKQSTEGVCFGEDVLTLTVEPKADQSLIMALVTVYGLINNKL